MNLLLAELMGKPDALSNRCTMPGCGSTYRLEAHHVVFRSQGGGKRTATHAVLRPPRAVPAAHPALPVEWRLAVPLHARADEVRARAGHGRVAIVDLRVLRISDHARARFCERVRGVYPSRAAKGQAVKAIVARLSSAELLEAGRAQNVWRLADCVAIEKDNTVTTIITFEQYGNGIRDDE